MIKSLPLFCVAPLLFSTICLGGLASPTAEPQLQANDWTLAGPFGGTALAVAVDPHHPSTLLAGGMESLLFKSEDSGASWKLLNFPQRNLGEVTSILIDPKDSDHYLVGVLAVGDGALFESHDAGKTWKPNKDLSNIGVRALAVSASDPSIMAAGTLAGVQLSTDSGKSWKRISDPNNPEMQGITAIAIDPQNSNIIYAGTPHLPWRTLDGGKTWQSIRTGLIDDSDVFSIYVDPAAPVNVFASACSGIYASQSRGDEWHKLLGIPNSSRRTHVIRQDPQQPQTIYAGTTTGLYKSVNSGQSWRTMTDAQVNAIDFDPSRPARMYLATEYQGIARSDDGASSFTWLNNGFVDREISSMTASGSELVAIEPDGGETTAIFTSADAGSTWSPLSNVHGLAGVHLESIAGIPGSNHVLIAAAPHGVYKSIDGGRLWRPLPLRVIVEQRQIQRTVRNARSHTTTRRTVRTIVKIAEIHPAAIYGVYSTGAGSSALFFVATDLGLLKSSDNAERWVKVSLPLTASVSALYSDPASGMHLIAKTNLGLFESKDCGEHWSALQFPLPVSDVYAIAIPADSHSALLAATRIGLYTSQDGGLSWKAVSHLPVATFTSVLYPGTGAEAYAVEYGNLYQTKDGGASWSALPTAIPGLRIRHLWAAPAASTRLYAIATGLGILFR